MARLPYTALVNLSHFDHPDLTEVMRDAFAEFLPDGLSWRPPKVERKCWEIAMAIRTLTDNGALGEQAEILGVGAGQEWTSFILTRYCKRVFATDLYLEPGAWESTAGTAMLGVPERFFKGTWNPNRLVVQHMDGLDLRYEDGSFDGMFSSSSIEHFGDHAAVRQAVEEMCRVLRPGGICSISTEYRLEGTPGFVMPNTNGFTTSELQSLFVDGLPWSVVGSLDDLHIDDESQKVRVDYNEAVSDVQAGNVEWSTYPHLVLEYGEHTWTSVHLTLRKDGAPAPR